MTLKTNFVLCMFLCSMIATFPVGSAEESEFSPLIYGTTSDPSGFDPLGVYDATSRLIIQNCFEGLFAFDCDSPTGEIIPVLAKDMGTWNAQLTEWTIPLRDDVKWWDGSKFTAEDVVWNLERLNHLSAERICDHSSLWIHNDKSLIIDDIKALGKFEVEITLTKPWLDIKALLAFWGSAMIKPIDGYANQTIPIYNFAILNGTGPFMLDTFTEKENTVLTRFEAYWLGAASIHEIKIQKLDDYTNLAEALFNADIHTGRTIPFDKWTEAKNNASIGVEVVEGSCIYFFHMSDLIQHDIRKAMQYAYNYTANEQDYFYGMGFQTTHPIPRGMEGYNANLPGLPYFDLELAREYLLTSQDPEIRTAVEANHLTKENTTLEWRSVAEGDDPIGHFDFPSWGTGFYNQLAENAKDIGVRIDHDISNWPAMIDFYDEHKGEMDINLGGWCSDYYDPVNMLEPHFKTGAEKNYNGLANATIDKNIVALHTLSGEAKLAKIDEVVTQIIVEQAHALYFCQSANLFAWNKDLITDGIDTFFNIRGDKYFHNLTFKLSHPVNLGIPGIPIWLLIMHLLGVSAFSSPLHRKNKQSQ